MSTRLCFHVYVEVDTPPRIEGDYALLENRMFHSLREGGWNPVFIGVYEAGRCFTKPEGYATELPPPPTSNDTML